MRKIALALSFVLVAATAFAFVDGEEGLSEMTLQRQRGEVSVLRGDSLIEVADESGIEPGDRIRTGGDGRAELRLEGQRRIELAPGSLVDVVDTASVEGVGGSLLATAGEGDELSIGVGAVSARSGEGLFRVDLGTGSSRIGVYEGSASIAAPGSTTERVERYFESEVAGNDRALDARPLDIDEGDAWDQIYLNDVLALDERITKLGSGLATQLGGARPGRNYFSELAGAPVGFIDGYLEDEGFPDLLIGFTIASNTSSPLAAAFEEAFGYRAQGGRWGLIARIMSASEDELVAQLGKTIIDTGILAADASKVPGFESGSRRRPGGPSSGDGGTGSTGGGSGGSSSPGAGPGAGGEDSPGGGGGGGGGGDPDPEPPPPEEEPAGCLKKLVDCLKDPVGGIIGDGGILDDEGILDDDGLLP